MESPPALSARAVGKRWPGGVTALRDVELEIGVGETLVLIGESGCGKTTLLRMFNRSVEPSSGEIRIGGRPAVQLDPVKLRRRTGYVSQDGGLLPHWTVEANVALVPRLLGRAAAERRERASAVLAQVGLDPDRFAARYPRELSGGQRQRVALARALAAEPGVVLLDEPFGALDALTRRELHDEFDGLRRRLGKTLLLVTHDLEEAERLGDRVAVMRDGRVLQCAAVDELRRAPADEYVERLLRAGRGGAA